MYHLDRGSLSNAASGRALFSLANCFGGAGGWFTELLTHMGLFLGY
jgi:hypothetical protein